MIQTMPEKQENAAGQPLLLEMMNIEKQFPGVKALDHARLQLKAGTVHALMGENGAGKSTLMKCLFGIYTLDGGTVTMNGKPVAFTSPRDALDNGVAMVHQELNQVLRRNVMENVWLGRFPTNKFGIVDSKKMYDETKEVFERLEIDVDPKQIIGELSVSKRQMVEIGKAVSYNAKILVLDEPTSSLTEDEVEHLFRIMKRLTAEGVGIIYISHKMDEILTISDEVTIMRDGQWITTRDAKSLTKAEIIRLMVGREMTNQFPPKNNKIGEVLLDVKNFSGRYEPTCHDVTFQLHKGEKIPEIYQQAAYFYLDMEPSTAPDVKTYGIQFDQKVIDRYNQFDQFTQGLLRSGFSEESIARQSESEFGNTFWWNYYFIKGGLCY